jgi:hypothetical protein
VRKPTVQRQNLGVRFDEESEMNRLLLAQEGYRRLRAALEASPSEETSDQAEAWLREEVCPVVEELVLSRRFRSLARWPVDRLAPGTRGPERQLVQGVDDALVQCARELALVTVEEGAESPAGDNRVSALVVIDAEDRSSLEMIAKRPWFDLVCAEEYFHAFRDLHLEPDRAPEDQRQKHTDTFRQQNELRIPLGDYVARSMFARIDHWKAILDRIFSQVFTKLPPGRGGETETHSRLFKARIRLNQAVTALTEECGAGDAPRQRNACVVLTQVYVGYAPSPNLQPFGCPPGPHEAEAAMIRSCVRRRGELRLVEHDARGTPRIVGTRPVSLCDPDVLRHIAAALHDVVPLYEVPDDPGDLIEWANDRARLVLVDRFPRALYWEGRMTAEGEWDDSPNEWNLMWTLARHARRLVTQRLLSNPHRHPIKSRRSRLRGLISETLELDNRIETRRGTGGYQLDLAPGDICLLQDDGHGRLQIVRRNQPSS